MSKLREKIGEYFKISRIKAGLTECEAADYLSVDVATLQAYEIGAERIPSERIFAMSNIYGIAPDEITSMFYELALDCDENNLKASSQ